MSRSPHPLALDPAVARAVADLDADAREYFEERAGIIEHDAGRPRIEAEREALRLTRRWQARRAANAAGKTP